MADSPEELKKSSEPKPEQAPEQNESKELPQEESMEAIPITEEELAAYRNKAEQEVAGDAALLTPQAEKQIESASKGVPPEIVEGAKEESGVAEKLGKIQEEANAEADKAREAMKKLWQDRKSFYEAHPEINPSTGMEWKHGGEVREKDKAETFEEYEGIEKKENAEVAEKVERMDALLNPNQENSAQLYGAIEKNVYKGETDPVKIAELIQQAGYSLEQLSETGKSISDELYTLQMEAVAVGGKPDFSVLSAEKKSRAEFLQGFSMSKTAPGEFDLHSPAEMGLAFEISRQMRKIMEAEHTAIINSTTKFTKEVLSEQDAHPNKVSIKGTILRTLQNPEEPDGFLD
ncbi:MAG: hypothetical protein ABSA74_02540, partial [Candidatus Staskawiczbacteria bacterium]